MKTATIIRGCLFVGLCSVAVAKVGAQGVRSAYEPTAPAADPKLAAEGSQLSDQAWSRMLQRCGETARYKVDDRVTIELDHPKTTFVAMRLPAAASESGYAFRGVALASAAKWRWATLEGGRYKWSDWAKGETKVVRDDNLTLDRGFTSVPDVVLKFDIVQKDGNWSATTPVSLVSYAVRPLDLAPQTSPASAVACD